MDEIVVCMSPSDWDELRKVLNDDILTERASSPRRQRLISLLNRLCHNANTLSLKWLDDKLAEFP